MSLSLKILRRKDRWYVGGFLKETTEGQSDVPSAYSLWLQGKEISVCLLFFFLWLYFVFISSSFALENGTVLYHLVIYRKPE